MALSRIGLLVIPFLAYYLARARHLDAGGVADYLGEIGSRPDHSLRHRLEAYARDHAVTL